MGLNWATPCSQNPWLMSPWHGRLGIAHRAAAHGWPIAVGTISFPRLQLKYLGKGGKRWRKERLLVSLHTLNDVFYQPDQWLMFNANRVQSYNYFSKQHLMETSRYEEPSQAHEMMVAAVDFISGHVNHTWVSLTAAIKNGAACHAVSLWIMKNIHAPFSVSLSCSVCKAFTLSTHLPLAFLHC